jgi:transposase
MKFSQIKTEEQQPLQTLETSRKFLDKELVALNNHIRAYLYEYGITLRRGRKSLRETIAIVLDDLDMRMPTCLAWQIIRNQFRNYTKEFYNDNAA